MVPCVLRFIVRFGAWEVQSKTTRFCRRIKVSIKYKIFIPIVPLVLVIGLAGYFLLTDQFDDLRYSVADMMLGNTAEKLALNTESAAIRAQEEAALFSRMGVVQNAYALAQSGNMDDESDPASQQARELLRTELKSVLDGYSASTGGNLKLHFHLPNGRSLVRMWRKKQAKRNGQWLDVSDDLSGFRQTVLDVNRDGRSRRGVEPGRGGFAIRGLAAVKSPDGRHLGSVEVLKSYDDVFRFFKDDDNKFFTLYMDAALLPTTTKLQDPSKNPVLDNAFVRVAGKANEQLDKAVTPANLRRGMQERVMTVSGNYALAYVPVKDYNGKPIGVIAVAEDISLQNAMIGSAMMLVLGIFLCAVLLPALAILGVLPFVIFRPLARIRTFAADVATGNLDASVHVDAKDEIGEIAASVERIPRSMAALIDECEGTAAKVRTGEMTARGDVSGFHGAFAQMVRSVNGLADTFTAIFDAMPFPLFTVDRDARLLYVNTSTARCAGGDAASLQGRKCVDAFGDKCSGGQWACQRAMASLKGESGSSTVETVHGTMEAVNHAIPLFDDRGEPAGALEIVVDQTSIVESRRTMERIANQAGELSRRMAAASTQLAERVHGASEGAVRQGRRTTETATAMEEMNVTVMEVARNSSLAAENAEATRNQAQDGHGKVSEVVAAVNEVASLASVLKGNMRELGEQADGIGRVMTVITDIADQTNLLALNAAIEAARAGEAGRGFAVVADEVRKLAEKTMVATKEVGDAINAIQGVTERNVVQTDKAAQVVDDCTGLSHAAGDSLQEIVNLAQNMADQVRGIATAAEEQSAATEQVARSTDEINEISEETTEIMNQSAEACVELSRVASELDALIADLNSGSQ
ncbi:PAS domain-containing protein [Pseudodesulfovibrio senegalensis]|uniref:PAS domain-containing protein n=1 Tax=Pseudodesulfovibrio senegalensis TaxID=1721087 RepID=A0A6N6N236_9BACT|nr:PAS domain-containing protein [Pseudodesulfovibrio senegalensis]